MFLIRLPPYFDESISSWRLRNGIANGCRFFPRPKMKLQLLDPDYLSHPVEAEWLQNNFNIDTVILHNLTLDCINKKISRDSNQARKKRWVIPCGNGSNNCASGPVACPLCLSSSPLYFRLSWRYAFSTYCPIHKIFLVDRCPTCSKKLWPFNFSAHSEAGHAELNLCHHCGASLHPINKGALTTNWDIDPWSWISKNCIPSGYSFAQDIPDFFDALWSICQLLGRKNSFKLWEHIPQSLIGHPGAAPSVPFQYFELTSISVRHITFGAAMWLMQDWPHRFVQSCVQSRVYRSTILSDSVYHPPFYSDVATSYLARRKRNTIRVIDVEKTIEVLTEQGHPVSKKRVRKALGISESKAVDSLLNQRRRATLREFLLLCGTFEKLIRETPADRDQLATLKRDYLIFLLSVLLECSIEFICSQSRDDVETILLRFTEEVSKSSAKRLVCLRSNALHTEYEHYFSSREKKSSAWFISRYGDSLAGHSVRARIANLITHTIGGNLWNSTDSFQNVLGVNYLVGRRQAQPVFSDIQLQLF